MKMRRCIILLTIIAFIVTSCNNSVPENKDHDSARVKNNTAASLPVSDITKAEWLIGKWKNNMGQGYSVEVWTKQNDSTYAGASYMIMQKDTLSAEIISLQKRGGNLFYIPTVEGQNKNQPVPFTLTNTPGSVLIFENAQHDFPQKITYTKIAEDSMVAEISGITDGKLNAQLFPMKRVN